MKLSVIIVNYNVKYFLEQCLHSVVRALGKIDGEIIVVDNNSVDGSVKMVRDKFPNVNIIANKDNKGFSSANNQAIKIAKGEYVLLLNPDTLVEDDTFAKVTTFMDSHPDAGALGVKMIDGKGHFLPESKRGLPTPMVAFYKVFGLSKLFPNSKTFGKYHLGYLNKDSIHEVDVLSGAFMLIRKEVLDKIGLLDETFFMYGEDIDLSYRITKAGYKNYYFPQTTIIHYKGESTKKSSINYVFVFYRAMVLFAQKHFSNTNARTFSFLINLAIYFRAFLSIFKRFFAKTIIFILDAFLIYLGIILIKTYWESNVIFNNNGQYPIEFTTIFIPAYILIWLISVFLSGGYDKPIRLSKIFQGIMIGTVIILVFYALLSESFRFSRALIIIGAVWATIYMSIIRLLLHILKVPNFKLKTDENKRFVIVGDTKDAEQVIQIIKQSNMQYGFIGILNLDDNNSDNNSVIGNISQIKDIIEIYKIDEVIFCSNSVSSQTIIGKISELSNIDVNCKIVPPESYYIIGNKTILTSADIYSININSINKVSNKRNKRIIDLTFSLLFLLLIPIAIFIVKKPLCFIKNIFMVMVQKKSWVGYSYFNNDNKNRIYLIGVVNPADAFSNIDITDETMNRINMLYAGDYNAYNDIYLIIRNIKYLGKQ